MIQSDTVRACRARLSVLRDEAVARASNGRWSDAESREWARLSVEHRMALLLLAGIDGELSMLAQRAWREMPGPERDAIKAEARRMKSAFGGLFAMAGRW